MADWATALIARLEGRAALLGLLGSGGVDWGVLPQAEGLPAVILSTVSDPRPDHFGGEQDFRNTRVQVDCWSRVSADEASRVAEEVLKAVRPVPGTEGSDASGAWTSLGVRFDRPQAEGPVDSGEQLDTVYVHRSRLDLLLWHSEEEGV